MLGRRNLMFAKKPHRRFAVLHIHRNGDTAVVASMRYNGAGGFPFEDDVPIVVTPCWTDNTVVGVKDPRDVGRYASRPD